MPASDSLMTSAHVSSALWLARNQLREPVQLPHEHNWLVQGVHFSSSRVNGDPDFQIVLDVY